MSRYIEINNCKTCPYLQFGNICGRLYAEYGNNQKIVDPNRISTYCSLPRLKNGR